MEEELIKFDCEPPTDHLSSFRSVEEPLQREEELYLQQLLCLFHRTGNKQYTRVHVKPAETHKYITSRLMSRYRDQPPPLLDHLSELSVGFTD